MIVSVVLSAEPRPPERILPQKGVCGARRGMGMPAAGKTYTSIVRPLRTGDMPI